MSRIILNIQYRLCFKKVCEMGEIFDKNLGPKLNVLKNFLLRVEREVVPWEHLFFYVASMLIVKMFIEKSPFSG